MTVRPMMEATLGGWREGDTAKLNVARLIETRMLIQANSGGGKSWALRRLLEQTAGEVQQLIIDPEGEFSTLRERHDLVIAAAHDGDALAHPRTAKLLAERLLETGVSAVLDIYDLKAHERMAFVRTFIDALVNAPKSLWRPALVVLDEAHVYAPEDAKAESAAAVIDLATRGRKRGFCLVAATQRIAKFNKDAAAELLNKLVGRTGLDVDVKRAAFELGMAPKDAMSLLRALEPGQFYAFGPAVNPEQPTALTIGAVETTHPKVGDRQLRMPPKPTDAIKAVLPKLADLPKEAEQELRTVQDLKRELASVRRELTQAKRSQPAPADLQAAEQRGFKRGAAEASHHAIKFRKALVAEVTAAVKQAADPELPEGEELVRYWLQHPSFGQAAKRILAELVDTPEGLTAEQLCQRTGYEFSGGFRNALSELRTAGVLVGKNTGVMRMSDELLP